MGRRSSKVLLLHKASGRWYRTVNGKRVYYGTDETTAYRLWHAEQARAEADAWDAVFQMPDYKAALKTKDGNERLTLLANCLKRTPVGRIAMGKSSEIPPPAKSIGPTLKHVIKQWQQSKHDENISQGHIDFVTAIWKEFTSLITSKPIAELSEDDFATWRKHNIKRRVNKGLSAKWLNDRNAKIKQVIIDVKRSTPSFTFPPEIRDWIDYKTVKHAVSKANKKRIPVELFTNLLAVTDEWAKASPDDYGTDTQSDLALRRCAKEKHHEGLRFKAILMLTINCSLDAVDIRRIEWRHVHLDGTLPYMDFPRIKSERLTGEATPRKTPLLPSTVKALRALGTAEGRIFLTAKDCEYSKSAFDQAKAKLFDEAGVFDYSFKHLRNVAPSLRRKNKMMPALSDLILGHTTAGTSALYEDEEDVDARYLVDLVNLVGRAYFGGETVTER